MFCDPKPTLAAALDLFKQTHDEAQLKHILSSQVFKRHSKNPGVIYDNQLRLVQKEQLRNTVSSEMAEARSWVVQSMKKLQWVDELSAPLVKGYRSSLGL